MRLNPDCVRAILLTVESLNRNEHLTTDDPHEFELLQEFEQEEVLYAVEKLIEARYINTLSASTFSGASYQVKSITWYGHQFLDNIRDAKVWSSTKAATKTLASVSLILLRDVAAGIVKKSIGLE